MSALFASGHIIDVVLAVVACEWIVLVALHRFSRRGIAPRDALATLLPGVFLMLAVRAALVSAPWPMVAAWLVAGFVAHLADLALRWRK